MLMLSIGLLTACGVNESPTAVAQPEVDEVEEVETQELTATFNIIVDEESIEEKEVDFAEGDTVMDVLDTNFTTDETDGFLESIEGYDQDQDNSLFWMYDVNGEEAAVGADEYELEDGDTVEWVLTQF